MFHERELAQFLTTTHRTSYLGILGAVLDIVCAHLDSRNALHWYYGSCCFSLSPAFLYSSKTLAVIFPRDFWPAKLVRGIFCHNRSTLDSVTIFLNPDNSFCHVIPAKNETALVHRKHDLVPTPPILSLFYPPGFSLVFPGDKQVSLFSPLLVPVRPR